ncbi:MAG: hypothetical protein Q8L26_00140 [Candidatus Omnitrophota bacterium]|nr:hypothetical protein [Candidatus Omnitrophota bacterium]
MRKLFILVLALFFIISISEKGFCATDEEIEALKQQVQELSKRIEELEAGQKKQKEEFSKQKEIAIKKEDASVSLNNAFSKLKIKGRAAVGYFDSGDSGTYPSGSFEVPDAKLQLTFAPDEINSIVMRFNLNNATAQSPLLDYFFLQSKDFLPALKETPFSLSARLGRFKFGFGEEDLSNNLIESVLPSNSAAAVSLVDEGLEFSGKIKLDKINLRPLGWAVSVSDGNSGVGSDSASSKAFMGKISYAPVDPLSLSASYYDSGALKSSASEFKVANLSSVPTGATNWQRNAWELDARYDFEKGKKWLDSPLFSDSKAILRLSYGGFGDKVSVGTERSGNFGFAEGIYNLTKKTYAAARYSFVDLEGDTTASLNSVTANRYGRYSLGVGYRWSDNVILKLAYDWNKESGTNTEDVNNDLLSAVVAAQF